MAEFLFIQLSGDTTTVKSVVLDSNGRIIRAERRDSLESLKPDAEGRRVIVLVPSADVIATAAAVPKASQTRLRQMLPFSLEEFLAADIETLHFAAGEWSDDGRVAVSVVARLKLAAWLDSLATAGIQADAVYAASDGVPDTPATLNLVLEGNHTCGRRPGRPPFALDDVRLTEILDVLEAEREDRSDLQHVFIYVDEAALQTRKAEILKLKERVASVDTKLVGDSVLARLGASLVFQSGTNLLQGAFAPKSNVGALIRPWYMAAGLAAGFLVLAILGQAVEYLSLSREDRALGSQAAEICSRSYSTPILDNCRAEMRRRLAQAGQRAGGGQESFLSTLSVFATHADGAGQVEALNYRNQVMDLQFIAPSVAVIDELRQQIDATQRFTMSIQSNTPDDAGINTRIQIVSNVR